MKEVKVSEENLSDNVCLLVSDLIENFYKNLEALFSKHVDKDLVKHSISFLELFAYIEGTRLGTPSMDIKSKKTMWRLEPQVLRNNCIDLKKRRFPRLSSLVIRWPMKKARKCKDHC